MRPKEIFLSYARRDRSRAEFFVEALEERGWSVWWDLNDMRTAEKFPQAIERAIQAAEVMVVLWSAQSVDSDWVRDEADEGKKRGILVPVLIDDIAIPLGYRQLQHARFFDAVGVERETELRKLIDAVERLLPSADAKVSGPRNSPDARPPSSPSVSSAPDAAVEAPAVNRPINLGFDGPVVRSTPDGWFNGLGFVSGVSLSYRYRVVPRPEVNGACLQLEKSGAHEEEFGCSMQRFPARMLAGKTIRFEAELCSRDVLRWAGLWLRADGDERSNLHFDNMHRRPIRGTTDWTRYHIDAQLPEPTRWLNFGVVLSGDGQLLVDNCRLLVWLDEGRWQDW